MAAGVDSVLPRWDHRERHELHVDATPERALAAAYEVTLGDMPGMRALIRLRGLGADPGHTLVTALSADGFRELEPGILVAVGRPWLPSGGLRRVDDFAAFAEPGFAKMAVDVLVRADGAGALLSTETRILLTDAQARRRFRAYWLVVRPFSGLIRRRWLRAAKRRAER